MPDNRFQRSEFFALLAATMNGTIGVFTRFGFDGGATHNLVAFWKCFFAFVTIALFCMTTTRLRKETWQCASKWPSFALLAFLGIFCLYFFETWAFQEASIPLVSFLTYAAGGLTILLSAAFLGEHLNLYKILAFATIIAGIYLLFSAEGKISANYLGITLALLGGLGYALYIFLAKLCRIGSGFPQLAWLFGFGSLYLSIPLLAEGFRFPSATSLLFIAALVLFPTIGGFYFTTKAVAQGEASKVQIIETCDPLFATLYAFILFGDMLSWQGAAGALCILTGLVLAMKRPSRTNLVREHDRHQD